jgi:hypothetical protein
MRDDRVVKGDPGASHDRVVLTAAERRVLEVLEGQADHGSLRFRLSVARLAHGGSGRWGDAGTVFLFLVGAVLMVATFTRWPAIAVVGVAVQGLALWMGIARLAPLVGAWASDSNESSKIGSSLSEHDRGAPR